MRDDVFKVKLGMKWVGWSIPTLAAKLRVCVFDVHSALCGNGRARDRALLRRAICTIKDELDMQCAEIERKYGITAESVLAGL